MEDISDKSKQIQVMFDKISPTYDALNGLLSFGQDTRWRERALSFMPDISTLDGTHYDIACGTGDMMIGAASSRKDYTKFVGIDLSAGMLSVARTRCAKLKINADFIHATAEKLPCEDESTNCVTISFGFRNVDNRKFALSEFYRVLKPNGSVIILDFFEGEKSIFSRLFRFYFRSVLPRIGGLFADKKAYAYLPHSVSSMPSKSDMKQMLVDAGFCSYVEQYSWLSGAVRLFVARKK